MTRLKEKIGYGLGDMSSSMFWKLTSIYLPILYGEIFKLDMVSIGTLMLVTRIWDAVSDPIMGIIADRTNTRWGKYRPYLLWGALPFAIFGVLMFTNPGLEYRTLWAYATYILMMTAYTVINVPYSAMMGVVSKSSTEKTDFASFRMAFAYLGSFAVLYAWTPLCNNLGGFDGPGAENGWRNAMIVVAAVCVLLFVGCFLLTKENIQPARPKSVAEDLSHLKSNMPWWILSGMSFCTNLFNTFRGVTVMFYFRYYLGEDSMSLANGFILSGEIANVLGIVFLTVPLSRRFGKKSMFVFCGLAMAALSIIFFYMPATHNGITGMFIIHILIGVLTGIISPMVWSMYADVADYSFSKTGTGAIGLIFSTGSMSQKLGGAIAGTLVMWLLTGFGLNMEMQEQSSSAIWGLKLCMSFYPAGIAIIMAIAALIYPLTTQAMREIHQHIATIYQDSDTSHLEK